MLAHLLSTRLKLEFQAESLSEVRQWYAEHPLLLLRILNGLRPVIRVGGD